MALTVRTDEQLEQALDTLPRLKAHRSRKSSGVRYWSATSDRGHSSRVDSSAKRMTERWGDVLERLGTE